MDTDIFTGGPAQNCAYEDTIPQPSVSGTGEILTPIGTKPDGELFFQDISQIPHFLVCGFSGAGKTSFVQTVTTYSAAHYPPEEIRFLIYDSKFIDYNSFNALPHLLIPVINDGRKAAGMIAWLSLECKKRLKLFAGSSAKDIFSYSKQAPVPANEKLPHLFVILDDCASLQFDKDSAALMDILQNGRSVGIHLIFVTSLASSRSFQKYILPNIPCRISFCVSTKADSRTAIEQTGAEGLRVPGELLFRWQNTLLKCQGVYMPDEDIQRTIRNLRHQRMTNMNVLGTMAAQIFEDSQNDHASAPPVDEEALFSAAVDTALESGQISASTLQHRLKVGYNTASNLVNLMEKRRIIGPMEGAKPRQLLITKAQWQTIKSGNHDAGQNLASREHTAVNKDAASSENPDMKMRDFAQFHFRNVGLCIKDNQIVITTRVMTKYGPGTTTASFNGKSIAVLSYKNPRMFSPGYIQFLMKPNVQIISTNPDLIAIAKEELPDILKIEFDNNAAPTMKLFMTRIAEDIGIPLTVS